MNAEAVKEFVPKMGRLLLGRRTFARFARLLWLRSRSDVPNDFETNGERAFQQVLFNELLADQTAVVFDVGANVGDWSGPLARDFERANELDRLALHVFEPTPSTFAELQTRMSGFGDRVHFNQNAVGAVAEPLSFFVMGDRAGTNTLQPGSEDVVEEVIEVDCLRLDDYCAAHGVERIDFLKIDVEGFDLKVLQGAEDLFRRGAIRFVQFEYNFRWVYSRSYLRDVFELVSKHGYSVGKLTPNGVERYQEWHPELESFREGNYLLFRDELPGPSCEGEWWKA